MINGRLLLSLIMLLAAIAPCKAEPVEPQIYYFGAPSCEFCDQGLAFLKKLKTGDPRVTYREFDIVANPDDATAFVQIVTAIGLKDPSVPMTIIGHHVIIGYQDDATTGREISSAVEQCRAAQCADFVRALLTYGGEIANNTKPGWSINRQSAKFATAR